MGVRKISISLDEDLYERARAVADAEGVSLSSWLSRAATEAAELASKQRAMDEYVEYYGEPNVEQRRETLARMIAEGHFDPPTAEYEAARLAALAWLRGSGTDEDLVGGAAPEAEIARTDAARPEVERRAG